MIDQQTNEPVELKWEPIPKSAISQLISAHNAALEKAAMAIYQDSAVLAERIRMLKVLP